MRYRGWSLVLILVCGTGYAFYQRSETQGQVTSRTLSEEAKIKASTKLALNSRPTDVTNASLSSLVGNANEPEVAATVNGAKIPTAGLNERTRPIHAKMKPRGVTLPEAESQKRFRRMRSRILNELINDELKTQVLAEAERKGEVSVSANALRATLDRAAKTFPDEASFRATHPFTMLGRDAWKRRTLLWVSLAKRNLGKVTVTTKEARAFHAAWPKRWKDRTGKRLKFEEAQKQVEQDLRAEKLGGLMRGLLKQRRAASEIRIALAQPAPPTSAQITEPTE